MALKPCKGCGKMVVAVGRCPQCGTENWNVPIADKIFAYVFAVVVVALLFYLAFRWAIAHGYITP